MADDSPHQQRLWKVIVAGTAIGFGVLAAVMVSMKDFVHGDAQFVFSWRTVLGFVVGSSVGWMFWRVVRRLLG
jgi:hypothetical protein